MSGLPIFHGTDCTIDSATSIKPFLISSSKNIRSIAAIFVENTGAFSKSKIIGLNQSLLTLLAYYFYLDFG